MGGSVEVSTSQSLKDETAGLGGYFIVLHNDDVNTFEFVATTLIDVCGHDSHQATQCAYITHYKGKCEVKQGAFSDLKPRKDALVERGLQATIEASC
jgi:ATP-dependent Clp protease adaptor protein ClpS